MWIATTLTFVSSVVNTWKINISTPQWNAYVDWFHLNRNRNVYQNAKHLLCTNKLGSLYLDNWIGFDSSAFYFWTRLLSRFFFHKSIFFSQIDFFSFSNQFHFEKKNRRKNFPSLTDSLFRISSFGVTQSECIVKLCRCWQRFSLKIHARHRKLTRLNVDCKFGLVWHCQRLANISSVSGARYQNVQITLVSLPK